MTGNGPGAKLFDANGMGGRDVRRIGRKSGYRPSSSKYRSRDIPAVRRLFLTMNIGTAEYLGITTGLITPGLVNVVAFDASTAEAVGFEDVHQILLVDRAKLWHASAEAEGSSAGRR